MRHLITTLAFLLLAASPADAQVLKLQQDLKAAPGMIIVPAETDCPTIEWWAPDGGLQVIPGSLLKNSQTAVCFAVTPGVYRLQAIGAKDSKPLYAVTTITVGTPTPPVPPVPPVPPIPPVPPNPVPVTGNTVLIVGETMDVGKLSPDQYAAMFGQEMRSYLDTNTPVAADKQHQWRIYDPDTVVTAEAKVWQDMMTQVPKDKAKLPWVVISTPSKGFVSQELPKAKADIQALLDKYLK